MAVTIVLTNLVVHVYDRLQAFPVRTPGFGERVDEASNASGMQVRQAGDMGHRRTICLLPYWLPPPLALAPYSRSITKHHIRQSIC